MRRVVAEIESRGTALQSIRCDLEGYQKLPKVTKFLGLPKFSKVYQNAGLREELSGITDLKVEFLRPFRAAIAWM
jgi:hypothetical protein